MKLKKCIGSWKKQLIFVKNENKIILKINSDFKIFLIEFYLKKN